MSKQKVQVGNKKGVHYGYEDGQRNSANDRQSTHTDQENNGEENAVKENTCKKGRHKEKVKNRERESLTALPFA